MRGSLTRARRQEAPAAKKTKAKAKKAEKSEPAKKDEEEAVEAKPKPKPRRSRKRRSPRRSEPRASSALRLRACQERRAPHLEASLERRAESRSRAELNGGRDGRRARSTADGQPQGHPQADRKRQEHAEDHARDEDGGGRAPARRRRSRSPSCAPTRSRRWTSSRSVAARAGEEDVHPLLARPRAARRCCWSCSRATAASRAPSTRTVCKARPRQRWDELEGGRQRRSPSR